MTIPFSAMVTYDGTISFTHYDGRVYTILAGQASYDRALEIVRELSNLSNAPTKEEEDGFAHPCLIHGLRTELYELSQPKKLIARSSDNRILVEGDQVTFDGKPVNDVIAKRLLWMISQGFDAEPLFKFLVLLSENPSYRAVQNLYAFMDNAKMAITHEGKILAYKRVTADYKDLHTKTFDNSIGQRVVMPRNEVNEDPNQTCSAGLHVCSINYLPHFGNGGGNKVIVCEIHPKDVVAVPVDYGNAKMRVCEYLVVGEVEDATDILGQSAVMSFSCSDDDDDEDDEKFVIEDEDEDQEREDNFDSILEDHIGVAAYDPSDLTDRIGKYLGEIPLTEMLEDLELEFGYIDTRITVDSTIAEIKAAFLGD